MEEKWRKMKRVGPTGPIDASIAIVGEAPGEVEELSGIPFVGSAGKRLNSFLKAAGINRNDCYITNISKYRPPDNDMNRLEEIGVNLDFCVQDLKEEFKLHKHNVIVACGNHALLVLTGRESITKWRGSILESTLFPGQKVIPVIHPAATLRVPTDSALCIMDFGRIKSESEFSDFRSLVEITPFISKNYSIVIKELDRLIDEATFISIDIETNKPATYIKCIGLTDSETKGLCIPIVDKKKNVWSVDEEIEIWKRIKILLTSYRYFKIIQNDWFELCMLFPWVGEIHPIMMDTMVAQKTCYPELKKGLDTICSIYTTQPYYKDDAKEGNYEGEKLWEYNVLDICITLTAASKLQDELKDYGMIDFFHGYIMPLKALLFRAYIKGVKVDTNLLKKYYDIVTPKCESKQKALEAIVGHPINVNSSVMVRKYLYQELKLKPVRVRKGTGVGDEETLIKLALKYPQHKTVLHLMLEVRQMSKLLSTYLAGRRDKKTKEWTFNQNILLDDDNRMRSQQTVGGTETGRLSAKKNILGKGCNIQNQPKYIRSFYISDEGTSFVVGDLRQVEARDVAYLSGDLGLKSIFKKGGDIHREVAGWVHKVPAHMITPEQRQTCKHVVHGANYDIGPEAFTAKVNEPYQDGAWLLKYPDDISIGPNSLLKMGNVTRQDGKWLLEQFHNAFPGVKRWHKSIVSQLSQSRTLTSPFGRRRVFFGWWGDDMFRAAYANIPQGMAVDLINMAAIRIDQRIVDKGIILLQVHDELVIQAKDELTLEVASIFKEEVERPIMVNNDPLIIPLELSIGKNWKETKELETL